MATTASPGRPRERKPENPSAFPREDYQTDLAAGQCGMTLRDWFAGQAFAACFSQITGMGALSREERDEQYGELSREMYFAADAMLAARSGAE